MDRAAIFIDAGYLFAQGSTLIAGTKLRRSETKLDEIKALKFFESLASKATGLPLLRIYWYDGTDSGPSAVHVSLAFKPNVKVRLGIVNSYGEQKGVDSLIVTDLINLSRNRSMTDAVLLTGDEDIRVGVQQAQEAGVRVHLVGLEPAHTNQSKLLMQEADTLYEVSKADVQTFLTQTAPAPAPVSGPIVVQAGKQNLEIEAEKFAGSLPKADVLRVVNNVGGGVPPDLDRQLLMTASRGVSLIDQEKRDLRKAFIKACRAIP
jgi:uncharacterized LabA/DUF88 family protein